MSKIKTQKDLIINLKSTNEYKRSKAIADCITFLSEKIKELELEKSNLIIKLEDLSKKNSSQKDLNTKLKSELEVQKSQNGLYKTKLTVLEELNKTLEQTLFELKNKIEKEKNEQIQNNNEYEMAINKYKKKLNEIKNESEKIKKENIKYKIIGESNKKMKNKIKKYEVLLYKMDLENQGYKDEIQKYQNQLATITGQNFNFIPLYKIDLNTELETIEGNNITTTNKENEKINIENNDTEEGVLTTNNENENGNEKSFEDHSEEIEITNEKNNEEQSEDDSKEEIRDNNSKGKEKEENEEDSNYNNDNNNNSNNEENEEDYVKTQDDIEDNNE